MGSTPAPVGCVPPVRARRRREYRVLSALQDTSVRVPRTILECDGRVRDRRALLSDGEGRWSGHPTASSPTCSRRSTGARIGEELIDALVELHSVDPASCGLDGFGKPTGYLESAVAPLDADSSS